MGTGLPVRSHEPYETYAPDLGFTLGHIQPIDSAGTKRTKGKIRSKQPLGFAPPKRRIKAKSGGRVAGTWPEVGRL